MVSGCDVMLKGMTGSLPAQEHIVGRANLIWRSCPRTVFNSRGAAYITWL